MDPLMDVIKNSEEPEWLERPVAGGLRLWQIVFLCLACLTTCIVMVCCCFRFRIPRTKQQIEADYQRRKITAKFRQRLETIHDSNMDAMSLRDAGICGFDKWLLSILTVADALFTLQVLELLQKTMEGEAPQRSSSTSPQQSSLDAESGQKEPPVPAQGQAQTPAPGGLSFVKFASRVATLSRLRSKSPSPAPAPAPSGNKMDF